MHAIKIINSLNCYQKLSILLCMVALMWKTRLDHQVCRMLIAIPSAAINLNGNGNGKSNESDDEAEFRLPIAVLS